MRRLLLLGLLALSALAFGDRYALLIGVDQYPKIKNDELTGSAYDLVRIGDALKPYNFVATVLTKKDATQAAITAKLDALAAIEHSHAGDEFVFYFSGRGSIAPPAANPKALVDMEPTLVPYDGNETNTDKDIRMKVIEDWAKDITDHGGKVTVILDCCFVAPFRAKGIGRQYRETTRCFIRAATSAGEIRDQIYQGPGVFLSACQSKGSAYEELANERLHRYVGAFTNRLAGEIIMEIVRQHAVPTFTSVMRNVGDDFKSIVHPDYMPGAAPIPSTKDLVAGAETFDKPMFGGLDSPNAIPPAVVQADNEQKVQLEKLRIGLDLDPTFKPGDDKARMAKYDQLSQELRAYVEKNCPFAEYAPKDSLAQIQVSVLP
ncbi:MAG TPA: caspase family protein, partial [Fimbriimonadaceae bacterium]|nr:caspase family protein [Fimbriimonadaceae bacterium]